MRWITPLGDGCDALPQGPEGSWISLEDGSGWLLGRQLVLLASQELPAWLADRAPLPAQEQQRWRIQRGIPAAPGEINDDTNPFEIGLADRVSLSKGCYVGQETLAKLATYDGVKQQLRRWFWRGSEGPGTPGTVLFGAKDGEGEKSSSNRAGLITSSLSLEHDLWVGLALVRRQSLQQTSLRAGPNPQDPLLELSRPPGYVDPPVGAGRQF